MLLVSFKSITGWGCRGEISLILNTNHLRAHQTPNLVEFRGFGIIPDGIPQVRASGHAGGDVQQSTAALAHGR